MRIQNKRECLLIAICLFLVCGISPEMVVAQSDRFGSNNLYYNQEYNTGKFTNAQYADLNVNYNDFYENLSPYGQWIEDAHYGFVWSPDVDNNFRPYYTKGHWALTDYGNTWVSDYQWGWAPFHYGRWTFDSYYGWLWIPGTTWGPAWVSWRSGNGSFGWAPLSPDYEFSSSDLKEYQCPKDWWVFLPPRYLYGGDYYRYWSGPFGNSGILKSTEPMDNTYQNDGITYVAGPHAKQIEKISNKPVETFHLNNAGTPRAAYVHNDQIKMYRPPEVKPTLPDGEKPVPYSAVIAPHPVSRVPSLININSGTSPVFRKELPKINTHPLTNAIPSQNTNVNGGTKAHDVIRADKNVYQSSLSIPEPQQPRQTSNVKLTTPKKPLPEQGPQIPEPVVIPVKKDDDKKSAIKQKPDPVPELPQQSKERPNVIPSQAPEPIKPPEN